MVYICACEAKCMHGCAKKGYRDTKIVSRHPVGVKETMVRKRKEGLQSSAFFFRACMLVVVWYPKRRRNKSFAYKRKDNNSYPKFSVLSEGGIKASHTKEKIITLIPSKPSSYLLKPRKDTCSYLFFCTTFF